MWQQNLKTMKKHLALLLFLLAPAVLLVQEEEEWEEMLKATNSTIRPLLQVSIHHAQARSEPS